VSESHDDIVLLPTLSDTQGTRSPLLSIAIIFFVFRVKDQAHH